MGRSGGCERAPWVKRQRSAMQEARCSLWWTLSCCHEVSFGVLHDSTGVKKNLGRLTAALSECVTETLPSLRYAKKKKIPEGS